MEEMTGLGPPLAAKEKLSGTLESGVFFTVKMIPFRFTSFLQCDHEASFFSFLIDRNHLFFCTIVAFFFVFLFLLLVF